MGLNPALGNLKVFVPQKQIATFNVEKLDEVSEWKIIHAKLLNDGLGYSFKFFWFWSK